jgi:hypothetical protein
MSARQIGEGSRFSSFHLHGNVLATTVYQQLSIMQKGKPMQKLNEPVRELTPSELASVAGGVAFAAGGTNSAAVSFATGPSIVATNFGPPGDGGSAAAILSAGSVLWDARAT